MAAAAPVAAAVTAAGPPPAPPVGVAESPSRSPTAALDLRAYAAYVRRGLIGREVGNMAQWSVTSAKTGNGVDLLRDNNLETYWQSDGSQPHLVDIAFPHKVALGQLHVYIDYKHDESYTPSRVIVRAGTDANTLREIRVVELDEPTGWIVIPFEPPPGPSLDAAPPAPADAGGARVLRDAPVALAERLLASMPLRAFCVQLAVVSNHQNGRDTHIRQVRVYAPFSEQRSFGM